MPKNIAFLIIIIIGIVPVYTTYNDHDEIRMLQAQCPTNCLTCDTSSRICSACIKGYWLQTPNICTKCPINCITCTNAVTCSSCASSTYRNVNTTTGETLCLPCSQNCLNCNSSNSCTTCRSGYVVEDSVCQRQPYVWWIIVLSVIEAIFLVLIIIVLIGHFKVKGMNIPETFFILQQGIKRY